MTGADVALVGMVGTSCFAADYYLRARNTCMTSDGQVRSMQESSRALNARNPESINLECYALNATTRSWTGGI